MTTHTPCFRLHRVFDEVALAEVASNESPLDQVALTSQLSTSLQVHQQAVKAGDYLTEIQASQSMLALIARLTRPSRAVVLQNRDRSTAAMIAQMTQIAAKPDYLRLAPTKELASGTPIVFANDDQLPQKIAIGRKDKAVAADGQRFLIRYAVVEASDILTSNLADGSAIAAYADGLPNKLRAIAGNGRLAGLIASFDKGTSLDYVREMMDDDSHGIDPASIASFTRPVLVRIMNQADLSSNIGDISNQKGTTDLSPVEQAQTDANRVDLSQLAIRDDGQPSEAAALAFIQAMPEAERNNLMDGKQPGKAAYDRLMAAVFWKAYANPELVRLYAQSVDAEIKTILGGMASAAPDLAKLDGAGDLDIRGVITDAASLAVNAKRQNVKLARFAQQTDMTLPPETMVVLRMMSDNIRSSKEIGARLRTAARFAYAEATKDEEDMFGPVEKATRAQVLAQLDKPEPDSPSLFDSVDPLQEMELSSELMQLSTAIQQVGDTDPLQKIHIASRMMEIIALLTGNGSAPESAPAAAIVASPVQAPTKATAARASYEAGCASHRKLKPYMSPDQWKVVAQAMKGSEGQWFIDTMVALDAHIVAMPVTYQQSDLEEKAVVWLHYFSGGSDWYITEKDKSGNGTRQAYGYAILNGDLDNAEFGYISIAELVENGVELDFHWKNTPLNQVLQGQRNNDPPDNQSIQTQTMSNQTIQDEPSTTPDPQRAADIQYLQSVIDQSADLWADSLAPTIEAMAERYANDDAMMTLWRQAIEAFNKAMFAEMEQFKF